MSQCTKEPCPHKPAIQEGTTKNQKRKKKKKLGKTNPKKHKQEKENTKESHTRAGRIKFPKQHKPPKA